MKTSTEYEDLYKYAPSGLLTFQLDGTILNINHTLLNWLGVEEKEIKHKPFTNILSKGGKLYYNLFVQPLLEMYSKVDEINLDIQTSTDSFPTLFSAKVYKLNGEKASVINGTFFKIADRKRYESELLKERDLVKNDNLEKTKALTDIAFNQSHLIRAPLANILGLVGLLKTHKSLDNDVVELLELLSNSALKLDTVIRDIVDLSD